MQNVAKARKGRAAAPRIKRRLVGEGMNFSNQVGHLIPERPRRGSLATRYREVGAVKDVSVNPGENALGTVFPNTGTVRMGEEFLAGFDEWFRWDKKNVWRTRFLLH